ncbi:SUMF1/EgtB/PvdO family nonheme iron enzyme [Psychroserpens sp.]|uniref:SUMF1/EgtB/PvdO family nonheme iron enzyme n=1 Tax=Psychroserpens sp. TaxID=2020870 RepID=UPI0039E63D26
MLNNETAHVMKGGSFLCHESYCASFRISSKMGVAIDSGSDHVGFRTLATVDMISN